jgi:hypothetical protein
MRAKEITTRVDEGVLDDIKSGASRAFQGVKNAGAAANQYYQRAGVMGSANQAQARARQGTKIISGIQSSQFITNMKERLDNGVNDGYIDATQVAGAVKQLIEPRIARFIDRPANQANIDKFANAIQQEYVSKKDPSATIGKLYNYLVYWAQQSITPDQIDSSRRTREPEYDTDKAKEITELVKKIDLKPTTLDTPIGQAFVEAANKLMDELGIRHS